MKPASFYFLLSLQLIFALFITEVLCGQERPIDLDRYSLQRLFIESDVSFSRSYLQHYLLIEENENLLYWQWLKKIDRIEALARLQWDINLRLQAVFNNNGSLVLYSIVHQPETQIYLGGYDYFGHAADGIKLLLPGFLGTGNQLALALGGKQVLVGEFPYLFNSMFGFQLAFNHRSYPFADPWQLAGQRFILGLQSAIFARPEPTVHIALTGETLWEPQAEQKGYLTTGSSEIALGLQLKWDNYLALSYQQVAWNLALHPKFYLIRSNWDLETTAAFFWRPFSWLEIETEINMLAAPETSFIDPINLDTLLPWRQNSESHWAYSLALNIAFLFYEAEEYVPTSFGFGLLLSSVFVQRGEWQDLQSLDKAFQAPIVFFAPFIDVMQNSKNTLRLSLAPGLDLAKEAHVVLRFYVRTLFQAWSERWQLSPEGNMQRPIQTN